jgi:hypothetical protein
MSNISSANLMQLEIPFEREEILIWQISPNVIFCQERKIEEDEQFRQGESNIG